MPNCALPDHLKGTTAKSDDMETDFDNPAQENWKRSWKAFGPRCPKIPWYKLNAWSALRLPIPFTKFALPFFPVLKRWREHPALLIGYNIPRWVAPGDVSVLFVPQFMKRWVFPWTQRGKITVTETKQGAKNYDMGHVVDGIRKAYAPSPIQNNTYGWSFAWTWPGLHLVISYRADAREDGPGISADTHKSRMFWRWLNSKLRKRYLDHPVKSNEFVVFFRGIIGRWDSLDDYYVAPATTLQLDYN